MFRKFIEKHFMQAIVLLPLREPRNANVIMRSQNDLVNNTYSDVRICLTIELEQEN